MLDHVISYNYIMTGCDMMQNTTKEERVALLELQVGNLDEDVDFLFQEQIIQDERLLNLETETEEIDEQLIIVDDDLQGKCR